MMVPSREVEVHIKILTKWKNKLPELILTSIRLRIEFKIIVLHLNPTIKWDLNVDTDRNSRVNE